MKPVVIFDLDGTIADITHRRWMVEGEKKDWPSFYRSCVSDVPMHHTIAVACAMSEGYELWLWSGRSDEVRGETEDWLHDRGILSIFHNLRMRPEHDYTPDDKLKRGWYDDLSAIDRRRILLTFDDRDRMVAMWRGLGVPCFQVAPGDF